MAVDDKLHQRIRDLGRALSEAIASSSAASQALHHLQQDGYSIYLLCGAHDGKGLQQIMALAAEPREESEKVPVAAPPCFQMNRKDLTFLNSIGIDPTRRPRRRRG